MFSSFFSTAPPADPNAPNFHPISSSTPPSELFGELEPKDTEWACPGGFAVETQIFYTFLEDGSSLMCQVIHSSVGVWYPTIQFTCKIFNPNSKEKTWKSVNVTNFVAGPPGHDKRSCKADEFSITHKAAPSADVAEQYTITANLDADLQITLTVTRTPYAPGFKVGRGPSGGFSYFGPDPKNAEGYVIHRFWPRYQANGMLVHRGAAVPINGPGMFVHAIQGMRPNLVAARWNFAHFQSPAHGGVAAVQMEFTTIDAYGRKGAGSGFATVNLGGLVVGGKLAAVTAETKWPDEPYAEDATVVSRAVHTKKALDPDTGYEAPTELFFRWAGPSLVAGAAGTVDASVTLDVGSPDSYKGLIEKVDVLAEIPYVIKTMVNYVAGTKPYIYQWINNAKLNLKVPDGLVPSVSNETEVEGIFYNEATFIS
ncbi:oxidative stress survival Svf1-like protein [Epithele typhae]|uniref:oxidative stress survival Svf1-like protein n=1 Tax=Epithele typhae TaxID=378194 RepID=UPI002008DADD|nr:oxidative stress survival Svf1-like protein [Epithele typhae]KAH9945372.1 oxidative stress survival Svf1-like protein [Epithele typhae]